MSPLNLPCLILWQPCIKKEPEAQPTGVNGPDHLVMDGHQNSLQVYLAGFVLTDLSSTHFSMDVFRSAAASTKCPFCLCTSSWHSYQLRKWAFFSLHFSCRSWIREATFQGSAMCLPHAVGKTLYIFMPFCASEVFVMGRVFDEAPKVCSQVFLGPWATLGSIA